MKNKIYKILVPIYFVCCLAMLCAIVHVADIFYFPNKTLQVFLSILLCLVGLIAGCVVHSLFHELGHVAHILRSAVILEFNILFLKFTKTKQGYKVKFLFKPQYGGYVSFVAKNAENAGNLPYVSSIGAWVGSFLSLVAFIIPFSLVVDKNYFATCILGGGAVYVIFAMCLNFLSFMPSSDGGLLFFSKKNNAEVSSRCTVESFLYQGLSLGEMSDELFSSDGGFVNGYYSVLRELEKGDVSSAEELLEKTAVENKKSYDNQPIALDLQKFYIAILKRDQKTVDELRDEVVDFCDDEVSPTTLRVMIAYRKLTGDKEWENALRKTFASGDCVLSGLYKTEKNILDKLS